MKQLKYLELRKQRQTKLDFKLGHMNSSDLND